MLVYTKRCVVDLQDVREYILQDVREYILRDVREYNIIFSMTTCGSSRKLDIESGIAIEEIAQVLYIKLICSILSSDIRKPAL